MVTMRGDRPTVERDTTLGVRNGELAYVGPDEAFDADADEVVDASDRVAMPGLVDRIRAQPRLFTPWLRIYLELHSEQIFV